MENGVVVRGPWKGWTVTRFYHKSEGRFFALLRQGDQQHSTSWARFLYETESEAKIPSGFEVDHIDEDRTNDVMSNLQLLTKEQNIQKSQEARGVKKAIIKRKCCVCMVEFEMELRTLRTRWKQKSCVTCGPSCRQIKRLEGLASVLEAKKNTPLPDHGTRARYLKKCRCDLCRAANTRYAIELKNRS